MKIISGKRMLKILSKRGWVVIRIMSSHHILAHPDRSDIISLPVHRNEDLGKGIQGSIMKQVGLTDADL